MVTEESLRKRYKKASTSALAAILVNKDDYTELAIKVAREVFLSRGMSDNDLIEYQDKKRVKIDQHTLDNYLVDLRVWHKLLFFVFWLPRLRGIFKDLVVDEGFILRSQQSNYYGMMGLFSSLAALAISTGSGDMQAVFYCLGGCFILAYLFDVGYNRQRLENNLKDAVAKGELPWGIE